MEMASNVVVANVVDASASVVPAILSSGNDDIIDRHIRP
jgi:hypothetical protein